MKNTFDAFGINDYILDIVSKQEAIIKPQFDKIDEITEKNSLKIISAFIDCGVSARHFNFSTGYGYSDDSRDKLDEIFAHVFCAEKAIVSPQIASGTHAISVALFGILRPGDTILFASGLPYDTLRPVVGISGEGSGSLADFGISHSYIDLIDNKTIDTKAILSALEANPSVKVVYFQRSRGYEWRNSLPVHEIGSAISDIKAAFPNVICMVDNCYGEFCEIDEPTQVGADVIVGSLIKNPGGGLAPTGGYVAGVAKYIDMIADRLTCPGIGREVGSYYQSYLPFYQGLYFAPRIVGEAMKGAVLTSAVFKSIGFDVFPEQDSYRSDITQSIMFGEEAKMLAFMRGVQSASPVDSAAIPYPWDMPGYESKVIMAAGTFIQGASIELSADGPVIAPYIAYFQGGLSYANIKLAILFALKEIFKG